MKRTINLLLICIISLISVITFFLFFTEIVENVFMGGSTQSTTKMFSTNYYIVVLLNIAALISLIFYFRRVKYSILFFIVFSVIWFISGRVVGINYSGELNVGWFFLKTEKIILWKENQCVGDVLSMTNFEYQFPFVQYENLCLKGRTYVGPFIESDIKNYLNKLK
jgi:hypothetical protein